MSEQEPDSIERCDCGIDVETCVDAWSQCLALEFRDPEYGAVHHLTVASYMLQHGSRLSSEGWCQLLALLREFVEAGLEPAEVRRRHWRGVREPRATLTRGEERGPSGLAWTERITDVRRERAAGYREDVHAWAVATLSDATRHRPPAQSH